MTTKRRCSAGATHEPWPCCGESGGQYGRRKGGICPECAALIKEGKAAREALKAAPNDIVCWTERAYSFPGYYGAPIPIDLHDNLRGAIFELVNAVSQGAPGDTPHNDPDRWEMVPDHFIGGGKKRRQNLPWPHLLSVKSSPDSWGFGTLVSIAPRVRAAIDAVDQAIRAVLPAAYLEGKERGSSSLLQLAAGEMSMKDFDEAIKPRKER